jgi:hypothetical protein
VITAFGVADPSGTFNEPTGKDDQDRTVFSRQSGSGFIIYIEGRPGPSRLAVGTQLLDSRPNEPARQPDLQMESSAALGNGSVAVCDDSFPAPGGVPAIDPWDFAPSQPVSDALNDLSCRFRAFRDTDFACTQDSSGNLIFGNSGSTLQFCTLVDDALTFPNAPTVLTARLRDTAGNAGPPAQIVVRITGR